VPNDRENPTGSASAAGEGVSWTIEDVDGRRVVHLRGEIDENADLSELKGALVDDAELDLEGISRINSCGVREWVNFVRDLSVQSLRFERCSPTVVLQLNTIYNFRGRARVTSFFAPYACELCHSDEVRLLRVEDHFPDRAARLHPRLPTFRCAGCGGPLLFDELPERYLAFLAEESS
jgi:hypothetical protein